METNSVRPGAIVKVKNHIAESAVGVVSGRVQWVQGEDVSIRFVTPADWAGEFQIYNLSQLEFIRMEESATTLETLSTEELQARLDRIHQLRHNLVMDRTATSRKTRMDSKTPAEKLQALTTGMSQEEKDALKKQLLGIK